ncbi:MAG: ABC transporter permease [Puniceicoccales bacterium]|jgi:putative ABC transport system permease protein|nr:ABC transporter permease [Puniceicoccales bacterium]
MNVLEIVNGVEIGLIYGITAIGIFLTFKIIDFADMTCDGSFVLGAAISGVLVKSGGDPWFAIVVSAIGGAFAGLVTGVMHSFFKISELLSGILVSFMLYSINIRIMGGTPNIPLIGKATVFSNGNPTLVLLLLCLSITGLTVYLLATDFGLGARSVGQSKTVAANYGVSIKFVTIVTLMLSNALIGLSGAIFNQYQGFVDISQGIGTLVIGLAAVMIGEKLCPSRTYFVLVPGCVIGSIAYRIFVGFALHGEYLGLETYDLNLITGLLVIAAMSLPSIGKKRVNFEKH